MDRAEETRSVRVRFDLLPKPRHRLIDRSRRGRPEETPDLAQELVPVDDPIAPLRQKPQNLELTVGEMEIALGNPARVRVRKSTVTVPSVIDSTGGDLRRSTV